MISGMEIIPSGRTTTLATEAAGSPHTEIPKNVAFADSILIGNAAVRHCGLYACSPAPAPRRLRSSARTLPAPALHLPATVDAVLGAAGAEWLQPADRPFPAKP